MAGANTANVCPDIGNIGSPEDVISRTLVFKVMYKKRAFVRMDFFPHVSVLLADEDIVGFGSIGRNDTWHLVVANRSARTRIMAAGDFHVDGTLVKVYALGKEEFQARVHWAPMYFPMEAITDVLERYGRVLSARWEKSPKSVWGHATTGVRTIVMQGDMEQVPHLTEIFCGSSSCNVLITITGRKPVCLRCRKVGHFRSDCHEDYCRHCRVYTHATEACKLPKTAPAYASVVAGNQPDLSQHEDSQTQSQSLISGPVVAPKETTKRSNNLPAQDGVSHQSTETPQVPVHTTGELTQEVVVPDSQDVSSQESHFTCGQHHPDDIDGDMEFTQVMARQRRKSSSRGGFGSGFGRGRGTTPKRKGEETEDPFTKQLKVRSSGRFDPLANATDEFSDTDTDSVKLSEVVEGEQSESWS